MTTRAESAWGKMTPDQRRALKAEAQRRKVAHLDHPLVFDPTGKRVRLWHRELPRTSQRRALQEMGSLVTLITGGNRSGKTEGGAQLAVATAMGRGHPDVQEWARVNGLDVSWMQPGPGKVWAVSLTSGDSLEYVRPKITKYLPRGAQWRNRYRQGQAWVMLPDGGEIVFKMAEQGRKAFQGASPNGVWFDEEPPEDVVNESLRGLVDYAGRCWITMTPLMGLTWVYFRWVMPESPVAPAVRMHQLHGADNPHIDPDVLGLVLAQYGEHERRARERGDFLEFSGGIYDFEPHIHVTSDLPDPDWPRFRGGDFGVRNPTAIVWAAVDPRDASVLVYAEHYQAQWTIAQHAKAIAEIDGDDEIEDAWGDPAALVERRELMREHGIRFRAGNNVVRPGISKVAELLALDPAGKPHLRFHESCVHAIREHSHYVWSESRAEPDRPQKKHDHTCDATRYLCMGLARTGWV